LKYVEGYISNFANILYIVIQKLKLYKIKVEKTFFFVGVAFYRTPFRTISSRGSELKMGRVDELDMMG
jgi:hypothetical protein